jgi:two-component system cell cycle sensor histidine kinase/response regulator CckA
MGDSRLKAELVRTLYAQSRPLFLANLVNGSILVGCFATIGAPALVGGWAAALVVLLLARYELLRRFEREAPSSHAVPRWGTRYVIGATFSGLLWGSTALLFFDSNDTFAQMLVTFTIGGMTAGATGTLSAYMPAFIGFLVPALTLLVGRTVVVGDRVHFAMAAMETVYGAVLFAVARGTHGAVSHGLSLRFENEALLERLEQNNRTLEQRVAERTEAFEHQADALLAAQRMEAVGRLAGGIAHDFNNLFTVVLANATTLSEDPRVPASAKPELEEIQLVTRRGAGLVRRLLAFGGKGHFEERVIDLNTIVTDSDALLRRLLGTQTTLTLKLSKQALLVRTDADEIKGVLLSLVANAREAMPEGGMVTITTQSVPREEGTAGTARCAELTVADSGSGMDAATRERAFEPFFTTKGQSGNSGLGLASTYAVISQCGGKVSIDSKPGHGSRVIVTLPEVELVSRGRDGDRLPATRTILLAEDEPDVRAVTARILKREGYAVLLAGDGIEALAVAAAHAGGIELLLTDVVMPRMGGVKLAKEIRTVRPGIRVLFVTGYEREESVPEGTEGVGLLRKPFTPSELRDAIAKVLAN